MAIQINRFRLLVFLIAFLEGGSLMATEIFSSKLLAPFFGNSLYVWISVFTITIGALSLGYFIGGQLSKKYNSYKLLSLILSFSLVFLFLLNFIDDTVFSITLNMSLKIGVLVSAFILIFPVVFCFGMISPLLIKMLSDSVESVGGNSGSVYTISTLGGILMTFIVGIYLIPTVGVTNTILITCLFVFIAVILSVLLKINKNTTEHSGYEERKIELKSEQVISKRLKMILLFLAFIEGAMVLAIEIIGSKFIQPVLGNSLMIWTTVIGVTITFLTIGYYIGGYLSKSKKMIAYLAYSFAFASFCFILIPIISTNLFESYIDKSLFGNAILFTSILIGPSLIFLGLTSPLIIQLLTNDVSDSGANAGKVYAISSLGGIFITLFLGMYVLETWGIIRPLIVLSIILILCSFILRRSIFQFSFLILVGILQMLVYGKMNETNWSQKNVKFHLVSESLMGQLKVYDEYFPIEELEYRFLFINGICQTIVVNNSEVVSTWKYVHRMSRIASMKRGGNALLLGMGGGSIATELNKLGIQADLVDIDRRMFEISKEYFYYKDTNSTFYADDARHFVNVCKKKYDVIIVDLVSGENQPTNLLTKSGFDKLKQCLTDDGIIVLNFQELQKRKEINMHHSICNTVLSLGMKIQYHKSDGICPDIINIISKKVLDVNNIPVSQLSSSFPYLGILQEIIQEPFIKVRRKFSNGIILEDDKPLLDNLNAETIRFWRKDANEVYTKKHLKNKNPIYQ
jgi:predicted membrane-bound spermidine synthase